MKIKLESETGDEKYKEQQKISENYPNEIFALCWIKDDMFMLSGEDIKRELKNLSYLVPVLKNGMRGIRIKNMKEIEGMK